jgi:hypothetical protein
MSGCEECTETGTYNSTVMSNRPGWSRPRAEGFHDFFSAMQHHSGCGCRCSFTAQASGLAVRPGQHAAQRVTCRLRHDRPVDERLHRHNAVGRCRSGGSSAPPLLGALRRDPAGPDAAPWREGAALPAPDPFAARTGSPAAGPSPGPRRLGATAGPQVHRHQCAAGLRPARPAGLGHGAVVQRRDRHRGRKRPQARANAACRSCRPWPPCWSSPAPSASPPPRWPPGWRCPRRRCTATSPARRRCSRA